MQIWTDLGLVALFKSCEHDSISGDDVAFRLTIGVRKVAGPSKRRVKNWRVPVSLRNSHEAVPPAGIPTAVLSSVHVSIVCSKLRNENSEGAVLSECLIIDASSDEASKSGQQKERAYNYTEESDILNSSCLEFGDSQSLADPAIRADEFSDLELELQQLEREQPSLLPSHPDGGDSLGQEGCASPTSRDFHELLSAAFQTLMVSKSSKPSLNVRASTRRSMKSLSEVAPGVFCLDYHDVSHGSKSDDNKKQ